MPRKKGAKQPLKKNEDNAAKSKGGRPLIAVDMETLEKLCSLQCPQAECAAFLNVSVDTLTRRIVAEGYSGFAEYFKKYAAIGNVSLRRKQFDVAMQGNVQMLIHLGKQVLGQDDSKEDAPVSEKPAFNVYGSKGERKMIDIGGNEE